MGNVSPSAFGLRVHFHLIRPTLLWFFFSACFAIDSIARSYYTYRTAWLYWNLPSSLPAEALNEPLAKIY